MTDIEKNEIFKLVRKSLEDHYEKKIIPALAVVISVAEKYPEQTDNQVRNALTHYTRALFSINDFNEAKNEIKHAEKHLERGTRDAYKIVLVILGAQVSNLFDSIIYANGQIPEKEFDIYQNYIALRSSLYSRESLHQLDQFFDDYSALKETNEDPFLAVINVTIDVRNSLLRLTQGINEPSFSVLRTAKVLNKINSFFKKTMKWFFGIIAAVILTILVKELYADYNKIPTNQAPSSQATGLNSSHKCITE